MQGFLNAIAGQNPSNVKKSRRCTLFQWEQADFTEGELKTEIHRDWERERERGRETPLNVWTCFGCVQLAIKAPLFLKREASCVHLERHYSMSPPLLARHKPSYHISQVCESHTRRGFTKETTTKRNHSGRHTHNNIDHKVLFSLRIVAQSLKGPLRADWSPRKLNFSF